MSRNVAVAVLGLFVFVIVAGAVYLQILVSANARDTVWQLKSDVKAGEKLTTDNIQQTHIPHVNGAQYYTQDPTAANSNATAAHNMAAGSLLFLDDVVGANNSLSQVTLTLQTQAAVGRGDQVDVYAQAGNQTYLVGQGLPVFANSGTNITVGVQAANEHDFMALQLGKVQMSVAKSSGVNVQNNTINTQGALNDLSGSAGNGTGSTVTVSPSPKRS